MKPRRVLLFSSDRTFDQLVSEALLGTGTIVLIARNVRDAIQIVRDKGSELDFALMDFNGGCRGMTLLSALHTCHQELPILVTTSDDAAHATVVARANGARACLNKPFPAETLAEAISNLTASSGRLAAAGRTEPSYEIKESFGT
jgi:DNA-binding NtrC family response regulator